jgi:CDP-glucose 4,6-dehydratase
MKIYKNLSTFFKCKRIVITGHTGFKGAWLTLILSIMGGDILGISDKIFSSPSIFGLLKFKKVKTILTDVSNKKKMEKIIKRFQPQIIFHLAAQSIVKESYKNPYKTVLTNTNGILNILEIMRNYKKKCSVVIITSDKCYFNTEKKTGYKEDDRLGGEDLYSASKASAEILINAYQKSFFHKKINNVKISSVRAGNVIGGGDWSKNRIIPDVVKSWDKKKSPVIRSLSSVRPWQHVLDPLIGYIQVAKKMHENNKFLGSSYNFGPSNSNYKVSDLIKLMQTFWKNNCGIETINDKNFKETIILKLNTSKTKKELSWRQVLSFSKTVEFTALWYIYFYKNKNKNLFCMTDFTKNQIMQYFKLLK